MDSNQMVVATLKRKVMRPNGKFDEKIPAEVIQQRAVVRYGYVERVNATTDQNGNFYEIDEKATDEYNKIRKQQIEAQDMQRKIATKETAEIIGNIIKEKASEPKPRKTKETEKTDN